MTFDIEEEIRRATEAWLAANSVGVPESIMKKELLDVDDYEPDWYEEEDSTDWPDDERLDDPRHVPYSNLGRR